MDADRKALVGPEQWEVVVDGTLAEPQLNHPEGICSDGEGNLWCGGERGEIYRIDLKERRFEQVGSTNGFALGMNFDDRGRLYICDSKHRAVFRFTPSSGELAKISGGSANIPMRFPNYPAFDSRRRVLYVSDSYGFGQAGPGIWRIDVETLETELWCSRSFDFANGLALSPDGCSLYVAESRGERNIYRIPIGNRGEALEAEILVSVPGVILDGLVMSSGGRLYATCYEPSRIYRIDTFRPEEGLELVAEDPTAHELCHPTNGVLVGEDLYVCNLGRWHITRIPLAEVGV
ncbi:SMP-30/gluconolactonase/LRE family protein [Cohnella fermenti]|nr:SMP-30/gluconolactonase/LRE family protein [Cohnella fermenti]